MSKRSADFGRCPHCGAAVEGGVDAFCCTGCETAWEIIRGAGLERYYADREAFAPRPEPGSRGWDTLPTTEEADGTCSVRLQVDGLRCASCVWVTEHVLQRTPGVREAHVSYATGRARLRWDPERTALPALAETIQALGYQPRLLGEESRPDRTLLVRLGVATFVALNVMLLSASIYAGWFSGMEDRFRELFQWTSLVLATPVALWCAAPFFTGAWSGLRRGFLHMDLPISLAVIILYGHGLAVTFLGSGEAYLDSLTMLVALLLAGRVLEGHGRRRAAEAATSLAATLPTTGRRFTEGGGTETVPSAELRPGDRIAVGAGEEFPADGVVVGGRGTVRTALITGESRPASLEPGQRVYGATLLVDGAVEVRVTEAADASTVSRMAEGLRHAADQEARPTSADRIAPWFTGATLMIATATLLAWGLLVGWAPALTATVAVLVVACPCALALSRPLAAAAGLGAAARRGLLLRNADALLDLGETDLVALDKTGTVTAGAMEVLQADPATLRIAAGLERFSSHPVARAIVKEAVQRGIPLPRAREVRETPGVGIEGLVDGQRWRLESGGPGVVHLVEGDGARRAIRLGDRIRADAARVVSELEALAGPVVLMTGDEEALAARVARASGISAWEAEMSPDDKAARVRGFQREGRTVLFAGDGLNDGPALAQADVGVAMSTGSASSILVAHGVVGSASLSALVGGVRAARAADRVIRLNQIRSIAYNIIAVGLAAGGLINPLVAAVLMPISSLVVVASAAGVESRVRQAEGRATPVSSPLPGESTPGGGRVGASSSTTASGTAGPAALPGSEAA